tara:strand:+ start:9277 stop:9666 length:390 start_codon:yes stop_codon:yes gene_type:complete
MTELAPTQRQKFKDLESQVSKSYLNFVDIPVDIRNFSNFDNSSFNIPTQATGLPPNPTVDHLKNVLNHESMRCRGIMGCPKEKEVLTEKLNEMNDENKKDKQILGINRVLFFSAVGGITFIGALLLLKK